MTRWGWVLLLVFIVLGLSGMATSRAVRSALWVTLVMLVAVSVVAWR